MVTQSIKKLSSVLQEAVFNDCDFRLLSNGDPASLTEMKEFDKKAEQNRALYLDKVYKVIPCKRQVLFPKKRHLFFLKCGKLFS